MADLLAAEAMRKYHLTNISLIFIIHQYMKLLSFALIYVLILCSCSSVTDMHEHSINSELTEIQEIKQNLVKEVLIYDTIFKRDTIVNHKRILVTDSAHIYKIDSVCVRDTLRYVEVQNLPIPASAEHKENSDSDINLIELISCCLIIYLILKVSKLGLESKN